VIRSDPTGGVRPTRRLVPGLVLLLLTLALAALPAHARKSNKDKEKGPEPIPKGYLAAESALDEARTLAAFRNVPVPTRYFSSADGGLLPLGDDANAPDCTATAPCRTTAQARYELEKGYVEVFLDPGDVWEEFGDIDSTACTGDPYCQFISFGYDPQRQGRIVCSRPGSSDLVFGLQARVASGAHLFVQNADTTDASCTGWDHYSAQAGGRIVVLNARSSCQQTDSPGGSGGHCLVTKTGGGLVVVNGSFTQRDDGLPRCSQPIAITSNSSATFLNLRATNDDADCNGEPEPVVRVMSNADVTIVGGDLRWTGTSPSGQRPIVNVNSPDGRSTVRLARVFMSGRPSAGYRYATDLLPSAFSLNRGAVLLVLYEVTTLHVGRVIDSSAEASQQIYARGWVVDRFSGSSRLEAPILDAAQGIPARLAIDVSSSYYDSDENLAPAVMWKFPGKNFGPLTGTACSDAMRHLESAGAQVQSFWDDCDPTRDIGGPGVDGRAELVAELGSLVCRGGACLGAGGFQKTYAVRLPVPIPPPVLGTPAEVVAIEFVGRGAGSPPFDGAR
jgi:hypothetical protein